MRIKIQALEIFLHEFKTQGLIDRGDSNSVLKGFQEHSYSLPLCIVMEKKLLIKYECFFTSAVCMLWNFCSPLNSVSDLEQYVFLDCPIYTTTSFTS